MKPNTGRKPIFKWTKVDSEVIFPWFWGEICIEKCFRSWVVPKYKFWTFGVQTRMSEPGTHEPPMSKNGCSGLNPRPPTVMLIAHWSMIIDHSGDHLLGSHSLSVQRLQRTKSIRRDSCIIWVDTFWFELTLGGFPVNLEFVRGGLRKQVAMQSPLLAPPHVLQNLFRPTRISRWLILQQCRWGIVLPSIHSCLISPHIRSPAMPPQELTLPQDKGINATADIPVRKLDQNKDVIELYFIRWSTLPLGTKPNLKPLPQQKPLWLTLGIKLFQRMAWYVCCLPSFSPSWSKPVQYFCQQT